MVTLVRSSRVAQVLRLLPGPVLRLLDAWSHGVARRRQQQRQQAWLRRHAAAAPVAAATYPPGAWWH